MQPPGTGGGEEREFREAPVGRGGHRFWGGQRGEKGKGGTIEMAVVGSCDGGYALRLAESGV